MPHFVPGVLNAQSIASNTFFVFLFKPNGKKLSEWRTRCTLCECTLDRGTSEQAILHSRRPSLYIHIYKYSICIYIYIYHIYRLVPKRFHTSGALSQCANSGVSKTQFSYTCVCTKGGGHIYSSTIPMAPVGILADFDL